MRLSNRVKVAILFAVLLGVSGGLMSVAAFGISSDDDYQWQLDLSDIVWDIQRDHPGSYSGSRITSTGRAEISFHGAVPGAVKDTIKSYENSHPGVQVSLIGDTGYTWAKIDAAVEAVHKAIRSEDGVSNVTTSYDHEARTIEVSVRLGSGTNKEALLARLGSAAISRMKSVTRQNITDTISVTVEAPDVEQLSVDDTDYAHIGGED